MAFSLAAIVGSGSVNLNDKNPFALLGARGLAGADVRRVTTQGAAQHGDTDQGFRLNARRIELEIGFQAGTDAVLDDYRDTLMSIFKPLSGTVINLRATRDDGSVRQLDAYTIDDIDIDLVPEYRPGHYHRATVRLYAPAAAYYNPTAGSVSSGTVDAAANWQYAGGAIGPAQVLEAGTAPTQGQAWTYTGTIGPDTSWEIAIRTAQVLPGTVRYPYYVDNPDSVTNDGTADLFWRVGTANYEVSYWQPNNSSGTISSLGTGIMAAGTHNYFFSNARQAGNSTIFQLFEDETRVAVKVVNAYHYTINGTAFVAQPSFPIWGSTRRWRSDGANTAASRWPNAIERYAVYSPLLTFSQRIALNTWMENALTGTVFVNFPVAYAGDLPEYPVISVRGPITGLNVQNLTTGETLSFGTTAIASGSVYVIDTRYGHKSVTQGTVSKLGELTSDSDLATWHLAPAPVVAGGTNIIAIAGTSVNFTTRVDIVYYNRYSSY